MCAINVIKLCEFEMVVVWWRQKSLYCCVALVEIPNLVWQGYFMQCIVSKN